ncbi:phage distal tail protein [Streptomyces sp. BBFR2]|uniref:phage distal tail protein n=1 Tax=Streptomyces sp. BBFR2 TaxID=3372854 RepID=UPI0037DA7346
MAAGDRVTLPGHVQFGDELLLGPGTAYRWRTLTGWEETPGLDSGTTARADAHGAFPGALLAQPRTITLDDIVIRAPRDQLGATLAALNRATAIRDDEQPLVIHLDDRGPLLVFARVLRRAVPVGVGYRVGTVTGAAVQFEASDPRRYSVAEQRLTTSLPMREPGLDWHLDPGPESLRWPLDFGAPGSTGGLSAVNEGDADTHPTVVFRGPVELPSLTNLATGAAVEYDLALTEGDELTVDTAAGTVTLNGTASRLYTATARSVPEQTFTLCPGTTAFAFRAAPGAVDPRAAAVLRWRSAYW